MEFLILKILINIIIMLKITKMTQQVMINADLKIYLLIFMYFPNKSIYVIYNIYKIYIIYILYIYNIIYYIKYILYIKYIIYIIHI